MESRFRQGSGNVQLITDYNSGYILRDWQANWDILSKAMI